MPKTCKTPQSTSTRSVSALLLIVLTAAPARPQTAAPPQAPPAASEPNAEQAKSGPVLTRRDVVVVTATRTETDVFELPVSVGLVRQEQIEQKQFNNPNVGEIVAELPGVSLGHGNRNIPPWIHLRGTGYFIGRTLYMVDELPLAEPMVSIAVHPSNLAAIEVVLGPSSSVYGANASGGVVNMRSGDARRLGGLTTGIGYGTFGTWRPQIRAGRVFGDWDLLASYNGDKSRGYRNTDLATGLYLFRNGYPSYLNYVNIEPQRYTNHYGYYRAGYRNPRNGFGFSLGTHVFNEDLYGGKENSWTLGNRLIGTGALYGPVRSFGMLTVRFGYQRRTGETQSTRGLLRVANNAIAGRYVFTAADANTSYVYDPTVTQFSTPSYTRLPVDAQMDIHALRGHVITAGVTYLADRNRSLTLGADRQRTLARTDYDIGQSAAYFQEQYKFAREKASLLFGVRRDAWKYHDIFDSGSTNQRPPDVGKAATTVRGGVRWQPLERLGLRLSGGTSFWPGAAIWFFQNLSTGNIWREANPNLKPERTRMLDFGADYVSRDGRTRISLTPYWGRILDAVSYVYAQHPTLPGVQIIRTSNSDEVSLKGIELAVQQEISRGISAFFNHTLNRSRITRSPKNQGNQLRNAPDYMGSFGLTHVDRRRRWGVALRGRYSDDRFYDDENTHLRYFHMREYLTMGVKLWKDFQTGENRWTLSVGVDNLTNSKYDGEFIYNAPGRFLEVRLTYYFGR
jgi:iron complex outermembrane receptor protein